MDQTRSLQFGIFTAYAGYFNRRRPTHLHILTPSCCYRLSHLVEPLNAPSVAINNWQILSVSYDRKRCVLELEMNTRERYQFFGVPRFLAMGLVKTPEAGGV